jgi:hypothetical protein
MKNDSKKNMIRRQLGAYVLYFGLWLHKKIFKLAELISGIPLRN